MLRRTRSALSCEGARYESFAAFISRLRKSFAVSYGATILDNLCFEFANYSWAPCGLIRGSLDNVVLIPELPIILQSDDLLTGYQAKSSHTLFVNLFLYFIVVKKWV